MTREPQANGMKPLYISATRQDTGKTTILLGLMQALRDLGRDAGYMKPVGQRYVEFLGLNVDEDAVLARIAFGLEDHPGDMSPIAIERGFTERYIYHRDPAPLEQRILDAYHRLAGAHDVTLIEGTGHAGVGSCFDLSNARVAELLGAGVVLITEGGIGKALDEAALSLHLFRKHGVHVLGVILNKVWPEKLDKIRAAVAQGCLNLGTRLLGVVPLCAPLGHPSMEQVVEELGGRVLCGEQDLANRVEHIVVAAMTPQNVCPHIRQNALVVTPGDRIDNILVAAIACPAGDGEHRGISGLILTGGFEPPPSILFLLDTADMPVLLCEEDTYAVSAKLREMRFKIRPEDTDKIDAAKRVVRDALDIPALLETLHAAPPA